RFLPFIAEPVTEIAGGPDLYINKDSTINLTCYVRYAPEPPSTIIWSHNHQAINFDSPRGGISLVTEKGPVTSSRLLIQKANQRDSGLYTCSPNNTHPNSVRVHIVNGKEKKKCQFRWAGTRYVLASGRYLDCSETTRHRAAPEQPGRSVQRFLANASRAELVADKGGGRRQVRRTRENSRGSPAEASFEAAAAAENGAAARDAALLRLAFVSEEHPAAMHHGSGDGMAATSLPVVLLLWAIL
ncbi:hypothetical protein HN011_001896, partial [Eciton burchellii]